MATNYTKNLEAKKKVAKQFGFALLVTAVVFIIILYKFAKNSEIGFTGTGLPSNNDAYTIAKSFIKINVTHDANFPEPGYQVAKRQDSIYVIRTVVDLPNNYLRRTTKFKLVMKYNGGLQNHLKSWTLLKIDEDNN